MNTDGDGKFGERGGSMKLRSDWGESCSMQRGEHRGGGVEKSA